MAAAFPDALRLRELKYGEKPTPKDRSALARSFLEAGRTAEALDLFLLAGDEEGAAEVVRLAVRTGRPVLLLLGERAGKTVSRADWKAAGEAAFSDRRWREAYRCFLKAEDEDGIARVREQLPDYEIYVPQGK